MSLITDEVWKTIPKGFSGDGRVFTLSTPLSYGAWASWYKKFKQEKMMRVKYLRNNKRQPYACFVHSNGDFGWSLCSKGEQFDKKLGRNLAMDRSEAIEHLSLNEVPQSIRKDFIDFVKRTYVFEGVSEIKCVAKASIRANDGELILSDYKESLERELEFVKATILTLEAKIEASKFDNPF